ncbi:MAG: NAD(P)-binding protein, partial [Vicinamibacterales bacterium]
MPLPILNPGASTVDFQNTSLSIDAVGRFVCSTWEEATLNGGAPFTAVIIGGGMYGAYCASKLFRRKPDARVLLLDAGRFLVSEHVQNLANIGLNVPAAISPGSEPGIARELVWGLPWRGNVEFPGLAYCTGGKSIYWGGWCPRLTGGDLANWPAATVNYVDDHYIDVESETGVVPAADFIFGPLGDVLTNACVAAAMV